MVERKAFLTNPNHQYRESQCGEHDRSAHNEKNRDYYEYPSLTNANLRMKTQTKTRLEL